MTDRRSILLLLALHLVIVLVVQPRGNFPLNDDWAYAQSVQWLLSEGRVRLADWIGMQLLPQTLAGGGVAALFGFSFEVLRHLTQCVAVLASISVYVFLRVSRLEPADAVAGAAAVMSFPAWPVLSNSYMSDLYGLLLALLSAACFMKALERPARGVLVAGTLLAAAAVSQRQVALAVPIGFMVAWLWATRPWTARAIAIGVAPLAAAAAAAIAFHLYLEYGPGVPASHRAHYGQVLAVAVRIATNEDRQGELAMLNFATIAGYVGLFSVGWGLWWGWGATGRRTRIAIAVGAAALAALALATQWLPPYRGNNVLDAAGIGPFTLFDAYDRGTSLDRGPGAFWRAAGVAGAFATAALAALLATNAARLWRERRDAPRANVFLLAVIAAYLAPFVALTYFDRYLLFVLPFVFALWAATWPASPPAPWRRGAAIAWILAAVGLSAAATRDYFSWNRARWDAIRTAERLGATPDTIDAGFEYHGWNTSKHLPLDPLPGKSWWWVKDDRYIVAFVPVAGYEEIAAFPVRRWMPRTPPVVRLLRRR
jgi:hypothetical protein